MKFQLEHLLGHFGLDCVLTNETKDEFISSTERILIELGVKIQRNFLEIPPITLSRLKKECLAAILDKDEGKGIFFGFMLNIQVELYSDHATVISLANLLKTPNESEETQ